MPFYLAQLMPTLAWSAVDVLFIISCSMSILKMLFVSHFDLIFDQNPEQLGHMVLGFSFIAGCVPHFVIFTIQSANGIQVVPAVSYYIGEPTAPGTSVMMIYGSCWCIASTIILLVAMLFIGTYEKWNQQSAVLAAERRNNETVKTVSLIKILFGSGCAALVIIISLISQAQGLTGNIPVQGPLAALAICLMLIFFTLDDHVISYVKEKLFIKFLLWQTYSVHNNFLWRSSTITPVLPI